MQVPADIENAHQRMVKAFIYTGLLFLLMPGTFLGVWNLIAISNHRVAHSLSPAWIQAHGQAQIFGWIGTFVIGIGLHSLSKMGGSLELATRRGWQSWALWTIGITTRWITGVYGWQWRVLLPLSTGLELVGCLVFFWTIRRHTAPPPVALVANRRPKEIWMLLVISSTVCFLLSLLLNFGFALRISFVGSNPAMPQAYDQRLLLVSAWGFLVLSVWGFNSRWLPIFLGLMKSSEKGLRVALVTLVAALLLGMACTDIPAACLLIMASLFATWSLRVFHANVSEPKLKGVHDTLPFFVKAAYFWLLIASGLTLGAALFDKNGGIVGASRHSITVGFLATMVFAIGPKILPSFCGADPLFSGRLMFAALALLNTGCLLRVTSEIPAYEWNAAFAWEVLPVSALIELAAVALFVTNLLVTFLRTTAHQKAAAPRVAAA